MDAVILAAGLGTRLRPHTLHTPKPLLAKNPPPLCAPGQQLKKRFDDGMESGNSSMARWSVSHEAVVPADFTPRDWSVVGGLPDRAGRAFLAAQRLQEVVDLGRRTGAAQDLDVQ